MHLEPWQKRTLDLLKLQASRCSIMEQLYLVPVFHRGAALLGSVVEQLYLVPSWSSSTWFHRGAARLGSIVEQLDSVPVFHHGAALLGSWTILFLPGLSAEQLMNASCNDPGVEGPETSNSASNFVIITDFIFITKTRVKGQFHFDTETFRQKNSKQSNFSNFFHLKDISLTFLTTASCKMKQIIIICLLLSN